MLDLSPLKLLIIVAVVLLVMGPDKLPEVAHKLGAGWRYLKDLQRRIESEVREAIPDLPSTGDIARIARNPVNLLNQLADRVDAKEAATNSAESGNAPTAPDVAGPDASPDEPTPLLRTPRPPIVRALPEERTIFPDPSLN